MYIREAHPIEESEDARTPRNPVPGGGGHGAAALAKTEADRHATAQKAVDNLGLTLPVVVDTLDNATSRAYGAWPDRFYIVKPGGEIGFAGEPGPKGFDPDAARASLAAMVAAPEPAAPDAP